MHGNEETRLRVTLLGTLEVRRGDAVVAVPGARLRGLIARLALAGGRPVEPGVLVDALWPQELPADPANALQSLVSRLRRLLGEAGSVTQSEGGYRLDVTEDDVDALRFERLAAHGRDRLRAGDPRAAAGLLSEAVALCGEPSVIAAVAPAVATRLARIAVEAGADLAEAELALGRADDAATRLTALLAEHPADERLAALQMDALAAQGRQADALDLYERVRETLADRLGADPGAALRERHLRLLRSPDPAPEARREAPASNLPAALTSFIGRDDDLARIDTLLARGRLVTVVGPGGAGKTRLAVEAGRRHRHEYRDGTWLVDLAAVTEPAKAGAAMLAAIGLRGAALFEASGRMRAEGSELDVLADRLNGRESLLVVDNCEHLIDAVAHLIAALLPRCAGLRVLATSREPLAIDGEALVPLGPLALPGPGDSLEDIRRSASVRLFTERAAAVRPGFDVDEQTRADVVRLVRGLDGMPLALELAAARLRTLSLAELAAGLSDRFRLLTTGSRAASPRHRTLRAVIAWSWDLLGENERTVAERVSVLPGGVTPESAAAVCAGTAVLPGEVPELLAALIDKSLLQLAPDAGRYRMLETLREYGIERLADQGALDAVRDLAARYLADLVAREEPLLRGPDQLAALRVMRTEYDNALAALRHLCDTGNATAAVTLAMDLSWYWQMLGRHADAAYWQGEALALPAAGHTLDRDTAEAVLLLNRINARFPLTVEGLHENESALRALADRLLAHPSLPGFTGVLAAITLHFLREHEASLALVAPSRRRPRRLAVRAGPHVPGVVRRERGRPRPGPRRRGRRARRLRPGRRPLGRGHRAADARAAAAVRRGPRRRAGGPARGPGTGAGVRFAEPGRRDLPRRALDRPPPAARRGRPGEGDARRGPRAGGAIGVAGAGRHRRRSRGRHVAAARRPGPRAGPHRGGRGGDGGESRPAATTPRRSSVRCGPRCACGGATSRAPRWRWPGRTGRPWRAGTCRSWRWSR